MPDPAPEHLDVLLALAATDASIRRNQVQLDDLPETKQLAAVDEQAAALRRRRADIGLERDQAQARIREHERTISHLQERMAAEQQRMYGGNITNAKEHKMLEAEIAQVQGRIDELELEELEAMEEVEGHDSAIADIDDQLDEVAAQRTTTEAARDEAASGLVAAIAELEVTRESQREQLPDDLRERYDDMADRHRGNAVGELVGERCTACGISLSYAAVNDLLEGPSLSTCPSCHRLIVIA